MTLENMTVIIPLASAFIGAASGYLGARFQTKEQRKAKLDEIAKCLTEMELSKLKDSGQISSFSSIAHWAVLRELLNEYSEMDKNILITDIRDTLDREYTFRCGDRVEEFNRHQLSELEIRSLLNREEEES